MKKFLSLLILLLVVGIAFTAFLLRNDYEKISQNRASFAGTLRTRFDTFIFTSAPRPVRLFLFSNMPGLFPVVYVCNHTLPDGKKESLFSGDQIGNDTDDFRFYCPNGVEGVVKKGGRARLLPVSGEPSLQLVLGKLELQFKDTAPRLESEFASFQPAGQPGGNRIAFANGTDGFALGCLNGAVKGKLELNPTGHSKKNFLLTRDCFFSLQWKENMPERHLLPGDLIALADFEKGRKEWAAQDLPSRLNDLGLNVTTAPSLTARIDPVPPSGDTIKLSWASSAPMGVYNCTLYTQENELTPPQAAHRFQAQAAAGELVLLKGFLKFWMAVSCANNDMSFTSNVLAPL